MAKSRHPSSQDVLDEFEGSADRLAEWARRNVLWLGIAVVVVLAAVWGTQTWLQVSARDEEEASAELARTRADYYVAMGAAPGALELPELANPEAAQRIRADFAERFSKIAGEYPGTVAGVLARLEAIEVAASPYDPVAHISELEGVLKEVPDGPLRAIVLQRIAQTHEAGGQLAQAAASYEAAGGVTSYPLREFALAEAARCYAAAGQPTRALELYERIEVEAPDFGFSEYHRALLRELRASQSS